MSYLARRVWVATSLAVTVFALYETVKTLLVPGISVVESHVITVIVAGITTFFVSRYALSRYSGVLAEVERQREMSDDANRLLSAVLATMREGVVIVNSQMDVVLYNEAATHIVKLPRRQSEPGDDSHIGFYPAPDTRPRLVDATRDPAVHAAFEQVLRDQQQVETRVDLTGREARSFQLNVAPLDHNFAVGVFFDITQLQRLERVRREFFANLSHELRTPLTAILAYAETLLDGAIDDTENRARFVEKLHKHASRMSDLISDISDLSAIESGQIKLAPTPIRLRPVVSDTIALTQARHRDSDISFTISVPESLCVYADRTRLEQILYNLIGNAVKFSRPGGVVTISAEKREGRVLTSVKDDGIGIAEPDLPRVFERLYRADKSRSRKIDGTGLGLAIVKHLVQAHGGQVSASSEIGRGSDFTFTLPAAGEPHEESNDYSELEEVVPHRGAQ